MKHARIAWAGAVHHAIERDGKLELQTPAFKGRLLNFDAVGWLQFEFSIALDGMVDRAGPGDEGVFHVASAIKVW